MSKPFGLSRIEVFLGALFIFLWLTLGRALIGISGYVTLIIVFFSPGYLIGLILLLVAGKTHKNEKGRKVFGKLPSILIALLFVDMFLDGIFIVDGLDDGREASVASVLFGSGFTTASDVIVTVFLFAIPVIFIATIVAMIVERVRKKA